MSEARTDASESTPHCDGCKKLQHVSIASALDCQIFWYSWLHYLLDSEVVLPVATGAETAASTGPLQALFAMQVAVVLAVPIEAST